MFCIKCIKSYNLLYFCFMKKYNSTIRIRGLVQGVGFRPFIYRLANEMGIRGEVENNTNGVLIRTSLPLDGCLAFAERIQAECPPVAHIHSIDMEADTEVKEYTGFSIVGSSASSDEVTQVSPDIAVCADCLADRRTQPHRLAYPFINCTHCGPRFTIIKDLPYDRERTTMASFAMCPECRKEYLDISDRRFHAQPVACNHCGPSYYATYNNVYCNDYNELLALSVRLIREDKVIAVRGMGGYHLVCNARSGRAVDRLREIKQRDTKPFAVMFGNMEAVRQYNTVSEEEEQCLTSWRRPIVLLRLHRALAQRINPGMATFGCILPYMPIHYDWFEQLDTPALVMTSGNVSDLPIAISPEEAEAQYGGKVALLLHHNRDIYNRADDSIVQVCGGQPCVIRRSRGYVPEPFFAGTEVEGILAFGAEKTNTFALGKGDTIIQSQYIGDLKNWETFNFYRESMERFERLFRFKPRLLVCDLHPDYLSSKEAERIASETDVPLIRVQHHHAHAVACMVEYELDESVVAIVLDGTGLGDDGTAWGGEFLLCDRASYRRLGHLDPLPMPGGDMAATEGWRMAVAYMYTHHLPFPPGFVERIGIRRVRQMQNLIKRRINTPMTSSAGRLFDAVSSMFDICDVSTYQGEAAILLEQQARYEMDSDFSWERKSAFYFHVMLADELFTRAVEYLRQSGAKKVVASGGCFQNRLLCELLQRRFGDEGIPFYIPSRIPCNDGGIAVGQLIIASVIARAPSN